MKTYSEACIWHYKYKVNYQQMYSINQKNSRGNLGFKTLIITLSYSLFITLFIGIQQASWLSVDLMNNLYPRNAVDNLRSDN